MRVAGAISDSAMYRTDRGLHRPVAARHHKESATAAPASHESVRYACAEDAGVDPRDASIRSSSRYARCAENRISFSWRTRSSKLLRSCTMLLPSPITNPWTGNGSRNARRRNAASTTVADTARHVADVNPAPTSRRPPSEMQITDCTASLLWAKCLWCSDRARVALWHTEVTYADSHNTRRAPRALPFRPARQRPGREGRRPERARVYLPALRLLLLVAAALRE